MVAATAELPEKPKVRQGEIPVFTRMKARNLYLGQCLSYKEISAATGLPVPTLEKLASREGWTKLRRAAKERLLEESNTRVSAVAQEALEAISDEMVVLTAESLTRVRESLDRTDKDAAKDFQAYTAGAKNLATTAKALRETGKGSQETTVTNFNLFFAGANPTAIQPKTVSPSDSPTTCENRAIDV